MIRGKLHIVNKRGLHARAAAKLTSLANEYESDIRIGTADHMVDSKNIMAVLMLAASQGTVLDAELHGADSAQAYSALSNLFARRFDEEE